MRAKLQILMLAVFAITFAFACKSKKETTGGPDPLKPGDAELQAVKVMFPDVTSDQLAMGYSVYTGPCTNCHGKKDIYSRSQEEWTKAINRMAPKAKITDEQKNHLTRYIFAMKATKK